MTRTTKVVTWRLAMAEAAAMDTPLGAATVVHLLSSLGRQIEIARVRQVGDVVLVLGVSQFARQDHGAADGVGVEPPQRIEMVPRLCTATTIITSAVPAVPAPVVLVPPAPEASVSLRQATGVAHPLAEFVAKGGGALRPAGATTIFRTASRNGRTMQGGCAHRGEARPHPALSSLCRVVQTGAELVGPGAAPAANSSPALP